MTYIHYEEIALHCVEWMGLVLDFEALLGLGWLAIGRVSGLASQQKSLCIVSSLHGDGYVLAGAVEFQNKTSLA